MISLHEFFNIIVMTIAVSFIFRRALRLDKGMPFWKGMGYAALLTAPAIILHEFGHKFVAMGFGLSATFEIPWFWLGLGVVLALVNAPIAFFVPAYIAISAGATPWQNSLISFAGPGVNGLLYLIALAGSKWSSSVKAGNFWAFTRRINGFLFIFNMIPIPPFDGWGVFSNLLKALGY